MTCPHARPPGTAHIHIIAALSPRLLQIPVRHWFATRDALSGNLRKSEGSRMLIRVGYRPNGWPRGPYIVVHTGLLQDLESW
jgi:hypothetical protein